jgi:TPR repeat protein
LYAKGRGVEQNPEHAAMWYRMAAEQGDSDAQYRLGDLYERGDGVELDIGQALKFYQMAADHGNTDALDALGRLAPKR